MSHFRLVYVGGIGRSGSTLLERLLGELPGVCSIGEVVHLWRRCLVEGERCGCGTPFARCPFWSEVGASAFGGWDRLDPEKVLALKRSVDRTRWLPWLLADPPPGPLRRRLHAYTDLYDRLYAAVAHSSGCDVIVDASKHASLAACLRWRYGAELHVLHAVRDPRAVAHSWRRRMARPEAVPGSSEREMARYPPSRTAVQWMVQNAGFAALERRGVPTRRVRYEDFTADPRAEFARIAAFIGRPGGSPFAAEETARLSDTHAVSGNPMRSASGETPIRADEAWREELAWRHRAAVSALTSVTRTYYGY